MSAQETARMSAFSALAIVGSDTMKIRVATPEMSCPIIALTRSSTSVCLAISSGARALSHRGRRHLQCAMLFDEAFHQLATAHVRAFDRRAAAADGHRPAAVAVVLLPDDSGRACFLLTRRAASLRELSEEVGLGVSEDAVLGLLDDYPTRSGFVITPVVVWASTTVGLQPNPDEVASVHLVPLSDLEAPDIPTLVTI